MFEKFKNFVIEHQTAIAVTTVIATAVTIIAIELAAGEPEVLDVIILESQ